MHAPAQPTKASAALAEAAQCRQTVWEKLAEFVGSASGRWFRVVALGRVPHQAQRFVPGPAMHGRRRQAGEPDLVGKAERPIRPALRQPDQAVASLFLCA